MTHCKHGSPSGAYVTCALGLYGGRPSPGVCSVCSSYDGPSRGLGDTIHKIAKATGLAKLAPKDCGCNKRRSALNQLAPYEPNPS